MEQNRTTWTIRVRNRTNILNTNGAVIPNSCPTATLALLLTPTFVLALDHDTLAPNRPIAIEDAYVIPKGEIGLEGDVTFNDRQAERVGSDSNPKLSMVHSTIG